MLASRGRGEDGTEFSPFASVLGAAEAERCQAGHVALPPYLARNSQFYALRRGPPSFTVFLPQSKAKHIAVDCWRMALAVEQISAITFRVAKMRASVRFYRDVLGMELLYGGEDACFSSLRSRGPQSTILNLEEGHAVACWGRLIFHVADVDAFWTYLKGRGFDPENPRDAPWGERYFHMPDPDGHELSFARPLQ